MKKIKKTWQKLAMIIIAVIMSMAVFSGTGIAKAADENVIDKDAKGSIMVTKYASTDSSVTPGDASGTDADRIDPSYKTLAGATFKLFRIADADAVMTFYDGTNEDTYELSDFSYDENTATATYNGITIDAAHTYTGTTDSNGTFTFADLPVGIYVLKEITAPAQIVAPLAEESLISIPMVNTKTSANDGTKWLYNVKVFPKNHESTGTVELTKYDQGTEPLAGVTFELYKKEMDDVGNLAADWEKVTEVVDNKGNMVPLTLKTDTTGKLTLAGLPSGLHGTQYKLVEVYNSGSSPEGYIINSKPLYFKMNKDNTITWNTTSETNGCKNENTGIWSTETPVADAAAPNVLPIILHNELPSLTKQVLENAEHATAWKQDEQYRLDDVITYKLVAYVPKNVAELGTFEIKDIPSAGITDDAIDSVSYGDAADACSNLLTAADYTRNEIAAAADAGAGFSIIFTDAAKGTVAGKYVQIIYKAHMNEKAVIAGDGNGNQAVLTYSKFIDGDDSTYTITDETRVYTYQYQITKYLDKAQTGNEVSGVEFELLYQKNGSAVPVVEKAPGVYRLALTGETSTTTLKTQADGTIVIQGLENGTYYLKETKTVANYNLLSAPVELTLNVTETTSWNTGAAFSAATKAMRTYNSVTYDTPNAKGTSTIVNKRGFTLPKTGSMGFLLFCVAGLVLIIGGAALIFGGKKKKIQ